MKTTIIRITEEDIRQVIKESVKQILKESYYDDDYSPLLEYMEEYDEGYILNAFKNNPQVNNIWKPLINPSQYQKALDEFVKYGQLIHFPADTVYKWMGICLRNICLLRANTAINGHDMYADVEAFVDVFFDGDIDAWDKYCEEIGENDWSAEWHWLEEHGFEEWSENGGIDSTISDYGLAPLEKIASEYKENSTPEETLVLINRMLDVTHMRGDLSAMFINGGAFQLDRISNSHYYGPM